MKGLDKLRKNIDNFFKCYPVCPRCDDDWKKAKLLPIGNTTFNQFRCFGNCGLVLNLYNDNSILIEACISNDNDIHVNWVLEPIEEKYKIFNCIIYTKMVGAEFLRVKKLPFSIKEEQINKLLCLL